MLDLPCGYGRHSLEFARRGYAVTGVDIRKVSYFEEYDVVLNMANGAIGYLENEEENAKIFDVIAKALKPGGKSFIDIQSGDYADAHFLQKLWEAGENGLTLSLFEWDKESRIMLYGQNDFAYGDKLDKPNMPYGNPTRLYSQKEIEQIMKNRGMELFSAYCDYQGTLASEKGFQLIACSRKLQ